MFNGGSASHTVDDKTATWIISVGGQEISRVTRPIDVLEGREVPIQSLFSISVLQLTALPVYMELFE